MAMSNEEIDDVIKSLPNYDPHRDSAGFWFDYEAARRAIDFFSLHITHIEGTLVGQPYHLERHEQALVANLFGWKSNKSFIRRNLKSKDGATETVYPRRFREVLFYIPRKNSKTTLVAGIAIFVLFTDGEAAAQCYCAAADKDQAKILYRIVETMVANNPVLAGMSESYSSTKTLEFRAENSYFKAISSEAKSKHGYNAHLVVVDELHAQDDDELFSVLETSTVTRSQPLVLSMTTADYDRPSLCNTKLDYAHKVQNGLIIDAKFLPCVFEADKEDDWKSEAVWAKANPNLGNSVPLEYMRGACQKAQDEPSFENTFKRLHLNIQTQSDVRWLSLDDWDACKDEKLNINEFAGMRCFAGLDLSSTTDLTSLCLMFPMDDGKLAFFWRNWISSNLLRLREKRDRVKYSAWRTKGLVDIVPGDVIDYGYIQNAIDELGQIVYIEQIAIDRWNASQISKSLSDSGLNVVMFGQGFASMSAPTKELERQIMQRNILHNGDDVARWAVGNVTVESDAADNMKPSKKKSAERIDPIVAAIMAVGIWQVSQEQEFRITAL